MSMTKSPAYARRIFAVCWIAYFGSYIGRIIFSAAMPAMISDLGFLKSEFGIVSTVYYISFAAGQLVNGYAGDRASPKTMVFLGLFGASAVNILMSFASSITMMAVLWGVNGWLQSLVCGVLPMSFAKWGRVSSISGFLSAFSCIGSALSGFGIGAIAQIGGWKYSFANLGIIAVLGMTVCLISSKGYERFVKEK